jgi:undecaprenyl-diphosphatase
VVILVTVVMMVVAGVVAWAAVRRWPQAQLEAPRADEAAARGRVAHAVAARTDPSTATGLFLTVAGVVAIVAGIGVAVVLEMVRRNEGFASWDRGLATWGATNATAMSTRFLELLTWFGSTIGVLALAVVAAALALRRAPTRHLIAFLALVVVGQAILANVLKILVNRARPDLDPLTSFSGPSFPSGHSTAAAACFAAFALVLGRRRSRGTKALLAGLAAAGAVGVAASRVLLGVHWFTDVMAGLMLGWAWFALSSIAFGGRLLRFGRPAEVAKAEAESAPVP